MLRTQGLMARDYVSGAAGVTTQDGPGLPAAVEGLPDGAPPPPPATPLPSGRTFPVLFCAPLQRCSQQPCQEDVVSVAQATQLTRAGAQSPSWSRQHAARPCCRSFHRKLPRLRGKGPASPGAQGAQPTNTKPRDPRHVGNVRNRTEAA